MKRTLFVLACVLPLAGCAGLMDLLASPEATAAAKAAGGAVAGLLGLPPGVGEAVGGTLVAGALSLWGSKNKAA